MVMQWMGLFPLMMQLKGLGSPFGSWELVWPCRGDAECAYWEPWGSAKWGRGVYRQTRSEGSCKHLQSAPSALHMHIGKAWREHRDPTLSSTKERNLSLSKLIQPKPPGERGMKMWMCCYTFTGVSHEEQVPPSQLGTGAGFVASEMPVQLPPGAVGVSALHQ